MEYFPCCFPSIFPAIFRVISLLFWSNFPDISRVISLLFSEYFPTVFRVFSLAAPWDAPGGAGALCDIPPQQEASWQESQNFVALGDPGTARAGKIHFQRQEPKIKTNSRGFLPPRVLCSLQAQFPERQENPPTPAEDFGDAELEEDPAAPSSHALNPSLFFPKFLQGTFSTFSVFWKSLVKE